MSDEPEFITLFQIIGVGEIIDDINDLWCLSMSSQKPDLKRGKTYAPLSFRIVFSYYSMKDGLILLLNLHIMGYTKLR